MTPTGHPDRGQLWAQVQRWIDDDVDPESIAELRGLLATATASPAGAPTAGATTDAAVAVAELEDRFRGPLTFGTAGLRGPLRAGPNGMNRAVVRRAAAGVARW
ncbi:MAG: phospho-sugar mutase, partial [Actinomycetota bacterium]|nr:phospho-sugar mutase [Actinomycetota bacterium]